MGVSDPLVGLALQDIGVHPGIWVLLGLGAHVQPQTPKEGSEGAGRLDWEQEGKWNATSCRAAACCGRLASDLCLGLPEVWGPPVS